MNARFRQHPLGSSRAPKRNEVTAAGLASVRSFHKRFSHSLSALQSQGAGGSWTFWLSCRTPLRVLLLPFLPAFGTYVAWPPYSSDCLVTSCWSLGEPEFCRGAVNAALSCQCLLLGCLVWRKFKLALAVTQRLLLRANRSVIPFWFRRNRWRWCNAVDERCVEARL